MTHFDGDGDAEDGVCRDELCPIDHVHPFHLYPLQAPRPKGQPKPREWWRERDPNAYRRQDPTGLRETISNAFKATDWPLQFCDVTSLVTENYGTVSPRSMHRYLLEFVNKGFIAAIDVGLTAVAYIRADSSKRHDLDNLREHLLGRRSGSIAGVGIAQDAWGRVPARARYA